MAGNVHLTVAYADTDVGGVMYHGRYVELAERSRLQWMLDVGLSLAEMAKSFDIELVVHRLQAEFDRPARLENVLLARTTMVSCGAARSRWRTDIHRGGDRLASLSVDVVAVSASRSVLTRLPDELLRILSPHVGDKALPPRSAAPLIHLVV